MLQTKHSRNACHLWCVPLVKEIKNWVCKMAKEAEWNIDTMLVTVDKSHCPIGWSKEVAIRNIPSIFSTFGTSHCPIGWSKELAQQNILSILCPVWHIPLPNWLLDRGSLMEHAGHIFHPDTSHSFRDPLNNKANVNILDMVVTFDTSNQWRFMW